VCSDDELAIAATCIVNVTLPAELDAYQFVFASPLITLGSAARDYATLSFAPGTPVLAGAVELTRRIYTEFSYDKSATTVDTSVHQVLISRKGGARTLPMQPSAA
jgi:transglutaminase-like putative cysteine protease